MSRITAQQPAQTRHRYRRAAAVAAAAIANGIAWTVGHLAHAGYVLGTPVGDRQIGLSVTVAATTAAGLAGWGLLVLFERYTSRPQTLWTTVAVAVLGVSIVPIFVLPADTATRVALTGLHCLAAAILIPGLLIPGLRLAR
jgi:hypothetical protein